MQMLTFEADNMAGALEKVRRELGEEAIIVRSRTVRKGGLFGLAGRERVEVCAALDRRGEADAGEDRWEGRSLPPAAALGERLAGVEEKLGALLLSLGTGSLRWPAAKAEGGDNGRAAPSSPGAGALRELASRLPFCGGVDLSVRPRVVAFVGPTGVGKTTTLLKVASRSSVLEGKRVTVVTADTFRLGAVEQLKAFSRVLRLQLRVALSPEELQAAMQELGDQDLILVDTPGGGQRDCVYLSEVKAFLEAAEPAETHLVLAATAQPGVIGECLEAFSRVNADRLAFTKLDEGMRLHESFGAALGSGLALSYFACGQRIPEDLEIASEPRAAELMIGSGVER
jgi:flagellar biosynthesis protein FlhF